MKHFLPLLLVISFIAIAAFGPSLFNMDPNHMGGCLASSIDGTTCPTNLVDFGAHHLSALQKLMGTATPPNSTWLLLFASLMLVLTGLFKFYKNSPLLQLELLPQRLRDLSFNPLRSQEKIISWLSLFELSPAL